MQNWIEQNGVAIVRTEKGIGVSAGGPQFHPPNPNVVLKIEVEHGLRKVKEEYIQSYGPPYRDYFENFDPLKLVVRVKQGDRVLAELGLPEQADLLPFMVLQHPQHHITENDVSVPPALHITDEVGAVWTLGLATASEDHSPKGAFAFAVLRDGVDTGEIASKIERRNGTIRVFTRRGWKKWLGRSF